jgi:hypothetical protein
MELMAHWGPGSCSTPGASRSHSDSRRPCTDPTFLQRIFTEHILSVLRRLGKKAVGWDELVVKDPQYWAEGAPASTPAPVPPTDKPTQSPTQSPTKTPTKTPTKAPTKKSTAVHMTALEGGGARGGRRGYRRLLGRRRRRTKKGGTGRRRRSGGRRGRRRRMKRRRQMRLVKGAIWLVKGAI